MEQGLSVFLRRLRSFFGPHPAVLVGTAVGMVALIAGLAYVFASSQANSRQQAERSFGVQARIRAQLASSLFTSSAASASRQAQKEFGTGAPSARELTVLVRQSHLAYALILNRRGQVLASSAGTPVAVLQAERHPASHVRAALAGKALLSNLPTSASRSDVIEWALPFRTAHGWRVELEGFPGGVLIQFLRGYLSQPGDQPGQIGFLVDANNRVIADSSGSHPLGEQLSKAQVRGENGRYVAAAKLPGSDWRILLTEPKSTLYPALAGSSGWILYAVLTALGAVGLLSLVLLRRTLIEAARVAVAHDRLAKLNSTLELQVQERTAVAERRAEELARSNSELEQFASVASHDLQEPLRKIRMYCGRLPKRFEQTAMPDQASSDLTRMEAAAERMQRLIDDLLSFARVSSRQREFVLVDLTDVAREVVSDLEARINELGAVVKVGPLPVVSGDPAQLTQLLQNLVSNALKFHRPGVPPLVQIHARSVSSHSPQLGEEAAALERCTIEVEDNGIGFDPKYAERIFGAFERLHSRSEYEGTGIGLSIARKIAWRHRGELTVTSTPGEGSVFSLTLPVEFAATEPIEEAA